jgi:hypothetical protein
MPTDSYQAVADPMPPCSTGLSQAYQDLIRSIEEVRKHDSNLVSEVGGQTGLLADPCNALEGWSDERFMMQVAERARNIISTAKGISSAGIMPTSADLLDLANRAARQCEERKSEDVGLWAERLAGEVGEATD